MTYSFHFFRRVRGFTLTETLIAVAVLAIAAVAAVPSFEGWMEKARVKKVARQLVTDLQFAKTKAVAEGLQYRISFNDAKSSYVIEKGNRPAESDSWVQTGSPRKLSDAENAHYAKGVTLKQNCPLDSVILHPDGSSGMGSIKVSSGPCTDGKVRCVQRSCERCITVIRTGRLALVE